MANIPYSKVYRRREEEEEEEERFYLPLEGGGVL